MTTHRTTLDTGAHIALTEHYAAHNYHPLPVVLSHGEGAWVTDVEGHRYLDCLAGYSALNFGHGHPRLLARAHAQLDRLTLTSRAFLNDQLGPFTAALAGLTGKDLVLPMNTGAEAVETALKVSRKWGYRVKGVPEDTANIVVMEGNFHGRTTTIVSFSDDKVARDEYGPFTPGVPHGALRRRRGAAGGGRRHDGRGAARARAGRGRGRHPARGLPARGPLDLRRRGGPHGRRRDPVRARPHRPHVRLRPRGRQPRRLRPRQGARRRALPGVGGHRRPRRPRRHHPRVARLDLRGQPARRRHRPRGRHHARGG